ncbi:MAG: nucleotidyltransferase domain-containing protein [Desulfobacteraceae bacterium]|nr:MAG: nucleotidyltransferase domain-containing protein [Desulfobacteraceae bacterium]
MKGISILEQDETTRIRQRLRERREAYRSALFDELDRMTRKAIDVGVTKIVLFGSLLHRQPDLHTDLDLLIVWETELGFVDRVKEFYRLLQPRVPADLLVYTPEEMERMRHTPFVAQALSEGSVLYEA